MFFIRSLIVVSSLAGAAVAGLARAEPVDGPWASAAGFGNGPIAGTNTNAPVVGDGSANSAEQEMIHAPFGPITLSQPGERIVFTGSVTLSGTVGSPASVGNPRTQFRFGLFDGNLSPQDVGWVGYYMSNRHGNASGSAGTLAQKPVGNGSLYLSTDGQQQLGTQAGDGTTASLFHDGEYFMNLTIERTAPGGLFVSSTLSGSNGFTQSIAAVDATAATSGTYTFDRLGFLLGGNLDADLAAFSNLSVAFNPPPTALSLEVLASGPHAGAMRIVNRTGADVDMDYYEITSASGSLNVAGWESLADQTSAAPPAGWHEAGGADEHLLSEANITGSSVVASGASIRLGKAFAADGLHDLQFAVGLVEGQLVAGAVDYVTPGDFNLDGAVTLEDLASWQSAFGLMGAAADADFDGDSDGADFLTWQRQLSAVGPVNVVPEPSTYISIVLALVASVACRASASSVMTTTI